MNTITTRAGGRPAFADFLATGLTPVGLEQLRLDRLFELRAIVDSLRSEHTPDGRAPPARGTNHGT